MQDTLNVKLRYEEIIKAILENEKKASKSRSSACMRVTSGLRSDTERGATVVSQRASSKTSASLLAPESCCAHARLSASPPAFCGLRPTAGVAGALPASE